MPYVYGKDDCSELLVRILKRARLIGWNEDYSADGLWQKYKHCESAEPKWGSFVFTFDKNGKANHCEIYVGFGMDIGAVGGGPKILSRVLGLKHRARVDLVPLGRLNKPRFLTVL